MSCADGRPATTAGGARARVYASSTPPVFGANGKLLVVSQCSVPLSLFLSGCLLAFICACVGLHRCLAKDSSVVTSTRQSWLDTA